MPDYGVFPVVVVIEAANIDQNEVHDVPLVAAPLIGELDVLRIEMIQTGAVSGGTITADVEHVAADETKTDLVSAFNLEGADTDTVTAVMTTPKRLTRGEFINLEITASNDAVTDGDGITFICWCRLAEWNGLL